jgi:hypothetical protein
MLTRIAASIIAGCRPRAAPAPAAPAGRKPPYPASALPPATPRPMVGAKAMNYATVALALVLALPAAAMEGDPPGFPEYDPVAGCESVYARNPNPAVMRVCIRNEGEFRDASLYLWSTLPPDLQTHCAIMAQVNGRVAVQYQTLHACLGAAADGQRDMGGEIPAEIIKKWLDADMRALKVGHY